MRDNTFHKFRIFFIVAICMAEMLASFALWCILFFYEMLQLYRFDNEIFLDHKFCYYLFFSLRKMKNSYSRTEIFKLIIIN